MGLSSLFMPLTRRKSKRWQRDLAEYQRLLAEQTGCSRETEQDRDLFYQRLARIITLYKRLY